MSKLPRINSTRQDSTFNISENTENSIKIPQTPQININGTGRTYIVQKGDSLYSIARKFNTTVTAITRLNNLTGTSLSIGQQLLIPSNGSNISNESNRTYIVQKGDSLYSISRKFNVSIEDIRRKNNLVSNLLSVGQTLII